MKSTHYWHSVDGCIMRTIDVKKYKAKRDWQAIRHHFANIMRRRVLGNSAVSILAIVALAPNVQAFA